MQELPLIILLLRGTLQAGVEMDVLGSGQSILDNDATPSPIDGTDFGTAESNVQTVAHTFTIRNTGTADLMLTGVPFVAITGPDAGQFSISTSPTPIIGANSTTTFTVTYTPTTVGVHNAILSIANNDSNENPYNFSITGQGTGPAPEIDVVSNGNSIVDGDTTPTSIDGTFYGVITQGITSTKTYFIFNQGNQNLLLSGADPYVTITGPDAALFEVVGDSPDNTITPGGSTIFSVKYTPLAAGVHNAVITIENNDSNEGTYNFNISGESLGQRPEIEVDGSNIPIYTNDTTPNSFDGTDFGGAVINTTETRDFRISNTGLATLTLIGTAPNFIEISGPDAAQFTVTTQPAENIASSGGSSIFQISYVPTVVGIHEASVSWESNDDDEGFFVFAITGNAVASPEPEIEVSGAIGVPLFTGDTTPAVFDNTDYGVVFIGDTKVFTHGIRNLGTDNLTIGSFPYISITGADISQFQLVTVPSTGVIPPSDIYVPYEIRYQPTTTGVHTVTVSIQNNDTDEGPTFTYTLRGESKPNPDAIYTIYYEDFNEDNGGWTSSGVPTGSVWSYGENPDEDGADGAHWYVTPYNDYRNNSNTFATSPRLDLTGFNTLELWMDVRFDTDADLNDGMKVQYSTDNGTNWTNLGAYAADPIGNWYNVETISSLGGAGWSGRTIGSQDDLDKSQFIEVNIKLPASLNNNPNVRLRVQFASNGSTRDNGVNFDNVFVKGTPITSFAPAPLAPGDVATNLTLWLKSDSNTSLSDGDPISVWEDLGQDNDAVGVGARRPLFLDNATENINHNPVIDFSSSNASRLSGKGGYNTKDYWVVVKTDSPINATDDPDAIISGRISDSRFSEDGTGLYVRPFSIRFNGVDNIVSHLVGATPDVLANSDGDTYGRAITSPSITFEDEVIIFNVKTNEATLETEIYKNGRRMDNYTGLTSSSNEVLPLADVSNSQYNLGIGTFSLNGNPFQTYLDGKISEVASYSSPNSLVGFLKIQSYLALKYGVSLMSRSSPTYDITLADQFYIDTNTRILWNPIQNAGFSYDVAAIGRDDGSGLNQKQSTSSNNGSLLTIGLTDVYATNNENIASNPNQHDNLDFLIWGNDRAPLAADTPIFVDLSNGISGVSTLVNFTSIERTWKVIEHGSVGDVKVKLPEIALSATLTPPGDYLMFVSDTPSFSPTSEYRVMRPNGSDLETVYDFDGTKYITFGFAPDYIYERSIDFDGVQDFMDADDNIDLANNFTASAWIKRGANSDDTDIISKRDFAPYTQGYALRINAAGQAEMVWKDSSGTTQTINSSAVVPQDEWHQIAAIFDGGLATLYIDGVEAASQSLNAPAASDSHFLIAASHSSTPANLFDGTIDEVRVWNTALTVDQLHYVMNQEMLQFTDNTVNGRSVPRTISKNEIEVLPWASLEAYFQMNKYTFTNVKDDSNNGHIAAIKNLDTVDEQTAPLPYISVTDGNWDDQSTWDNGTLFDTPNAPSVVNPSVTVDWNIVRTNHNITTAANTTVLALSVNSNEFTVTGDKKLEVSHYLRLDGRIDLEGESQLIQTENSDLDVISVGRLERDQQGTEDIYSYNFWASPVSGINPSSINNPYSMQSVMRDGSDPNNPQSFVFSGGYDGAPTSPLTISAYWLYKFANMAGNGAGWQYIGTAGTIDVGLGYTMKGAGASNPFGEQNYVFIGKPNNGTDAQTIALPITAGNLSLLGNPFASSLDAHAFINDNPHLDGTLYFWEHWGGGTHIQAGYQGGYAMRNLTTGVPAASHPDVSQVGVGTKTPTRYVAVGQGFFVVASSGGNTTFTNAQRVFQLETDGSSVHFFNVPQGDDTAASAQADTSETNYAQDSYSQEEDLREIYKIGFESPQQYHRQIAIGVDENATFEIDRGYDAILVDPNPEDMTWYQQEKSLAILGVPNLVEQDIYPLRVITATPGEIRIGIDQLENVDTEVVRIYLHDTSDDSYTNLLEESFTIQLEPSDYVGRFEIVFKRDTQTEEEEEEEETQDNQDDETQTVEVSEVALEETQLQDEMALDEMTATFNTNEQTIVLFKNIDNNVESISLYSILGQKVAAWTPQNQGTSIVLPVSGIATGPYVLRAQTDQGLLTKKLIIH